MKKIFSIVFIFFIFFFLCSCSDKTNDNKTFDEQDTTLESENSKNEIEDEVVNHDHVYKLIQTIEPSCTQIGRKEYVCEICGKTQAPSDVPALGHKYDYVYTKYATCTENGNIAEKCLVCGYINSNNTTPAKGHNLNAEYYVDGTKIIIDFYCYESTCNYNKNKIGNIVYDTGVKITSDLHTYDYTSIYTGPNGDLIYNEVGKLPKWVFITGKVKNGDAYKYMVSLIYTENQGINYNDLPIDYTTRKEYWISSSFNSSSSQLVFEYECKVEENKLILIETS